ncbi:unnamed protein product [Symbiodinium natans]|uniref:Uncharacterized protein n=1 Tax=Symbiodinium natans TaxID=878477 RepID=A0A812LMK1_9DINO|nr:unnamed protein product [Symbiodinium natans]
MATASARRKHSKAWAGKRNLVKVLRKTWRGCLQLHHRADGGTQLLRMRDLAQASGFFRECPGLHEDEDGTMSPATSVSDVCLLIPTSARLSRGARSLLPDVLLWLVGAAHLPLGVATVFVDQDLRPVALRSLSRARARRSQYDAVIAVRLLALSRYLLCERLHAAVERWLWRSGVVGRQAFASQLLDGDAKEGFSLGDACASFKTLGARRGLARGLAELAGDLQNISEAATLLTDDCAIVREHVLRALCKATSEAASACAQAIAGCLQDESAEVSGQAAMTLCHLAAQSGSKLQAQEVAKLVAPLLANSDPHIVEAASEGMAKLGTCAAPFAVRCLEADSKLERHAGVCILEGLGSQRGGGEAVEAALGLLQHRSPEVRRAALRVLERLSKLSSKDGVGRIGAVALTPTAVERIGAALDDESGRVRGVAALALANLGSEAVEPFAGHLVMTLRGGVSGEVDAAELREVLEALTRLGRDARWAAQAVADLFLISAWSVRRSAAIAYGQICGDTAEAPKGEGQTRTDSEAEDGAVGAGAGADTVRTAAARLAKMLEDEIPDVAEGAAKALGRLGFQGACCARQLASCLDDQDDHLARACLDSLLSLLRASCGATQEAAAAGLGSCFEKGGKAPVEARERLAAALVTAAQSDDRSVREESVRALGHLGSAASCEQTGRGCRRPMSRLQCRIFETVIDGLEDVSVAVQRAAMDALGVLRLPRQAGQQREAVLRSLLGGPSKSLRLHAMAALARCQADQMTNLEPAEDLTRFAKKRRRPCSQQKEHH